MSETAEKTIQTTDVTKAEMQLALSREGLAYQALLQECENVTFTKDNLNEDRSCLTNLRKVKSSLEKMENPHTAKWKAWNDARKSLVDPVGELLNRKTNEYKVLAQEVAEEARKSEAEKQRKAGILSEIDNFFITQSQAIAAATEPSELVRIEKLIGSHKANASRYQEFLPLMGQKSSILADLIKKQKEALKQLDGLKQAENAANEIGDDQAVLESREKQEEITAKIEENKEMVQSEAINMATNSDVVEPEIIIPIAPKARRTTVKCEIVDVKLAYKNGYMKLVADDEKINELVKSIDRKTLTEQGIAQNGLRVYLHKEW